MKIYDLIIVGGGIGGMTAAARVKNKSVLILDANDRIGKKLLSTGAGKCNFLNENFDVGKYNDESFVSATFEKYGFFEIKKFFESLGLLMRFDEEGRGYPLTESANTVLDAYRRAIQKNGVEVKTSALVTKISKQNDVFKVLGGVDYYGKNVFFATGSNAGFGYDSTGVLSDFANVKNFTPSLAPLSTDTTYIKGLNGVRVKAKVGLIVDNKVVHEEYGEVLFKSFGLSGIATFNNSAYYARLGAPKNAYLSLNFLNENKNETFLILKRLKEFSNDVGELLSGAFHKMIAQQILNMAGIQGSAKATDENLQKLADVVSDFRIKITGVSDKSLAQVMSGGIDASCVNKNTLEIKGVNSLFVGGEILNIDGLSGGYNIMWAVASAIKVSDEISEKP